MTFLSAQDVRNEVLALADGAGYSNVDDAILDSILSEKELYCAVSTHGESFLEAFFNRNLQSFAHSDVLFLLLTETYTVDDREYMALLDRHTFRYSGYIKTTVDSSPVTIRFYYAVDPIGDMT